MKYIWMIVLGCALFSGSSAWGDDKLPPKPAAKDKCPVCGMFVAKYPDFLVAITYGDGSWVYFDGAKDMFKYYFDVSKYHSSRKQSQIQSVYVTDYYNLTYVDAYEALYVIGSDVYGPMGRELIPFETETDAREFMQDHQGESLVRFREVTPSLVKSLD